MNLPALTRGNPYDRRRTSSLSDWIRVVLLLAAFGAGLMHFEHRLTVIEDGLADLKQYVLGAKH